MPCQDCQICPNRSPLTRYPSCCRRSCLPKILVKHISMLSRYFKANTNCRRWRKAIATSPQETAQMLILFKTSFLWMIRLVQSLKSITAWWAPLRGPLNSSRVTLRKEKTQLNNNTWTSWFLSTKWVTS